MNDDTKCIDDDSEVLTPKQELELIALEAWMDEALKPMKTGEPVDQVAASKWLAVVDELADLDDDDMTRHSELAQLLASVARK